MEKGFGNAAWQVTVKKHGSGPEVVLKVHEDGTVKDVKEELARWLGRPELHNVMR